MSVVPKFTFLLLLAACGDPAASSAPTPTSEAPPHATAAVSVVVPQNALLRRAEPSTVCMMNNRFMDSEQIPVVVDGRTYFGCCAMCKDKLENDAAARTGKDHVTGKPVDKASAIIGVKPNGTVLYFESETTFAAYRGSEAPAAPPAPPAPASSASAAPPAAPPGPPSAAAGGPPPPAVGAPRPPAPASATPKAPAAPPPPPVPATPPPAGSVDHSAHKGH